MNTSGSGVGRRSRGSRACRWRIAAPASAAPIASSAICSGVIGRYGDIVGVWIEPVTAQVMMTVRRDGATSVVLDQAANRAADVESGTRNELRPSGDARKTDGVCDVFRRGRSPWASANPAGTASTDASRSRP